MNLLFSVKYFPVFLEHQNSKKVLLSLQIYMHIFLKRLSNEIEYKMIWRYGWDGSKWDKICTLVDADNIFCSK